MKISKEMQKQMHIAAAIYATASKIMAGIDMYLTSKGADPEVYRVGNGISLDELEYGNDITDEFCAWAERDFE